MTRIPNEYSKEGEEQIIVVLRRRGNGRKYRMENAFSIACVQYIPYGSNTLALSVYRSLFCREHVLQAIIMRID
jgi:hypothetical protein